MYLVVSYTWATVINSVQQANREVAEQINQGLSTMYFGKMQVI